MVVWVSRESRGAGEERERGAALRGRDTWRLFEGFEKATRGRWRFYGDGDFTRVLGG